MNRLAFILVLFAAASASAQKTFVGLTGMVFRYHGDTIWVERDTNLTRVVYRGDTVFKTMTMDGRPRLDQVYLLRGDSARLLEMRDSTGHTRSMPSMPSYPSTVATMERQQLEIELRGNDARQRMSQIGVDWYTPPPLPDPAHEYKVSPAKMIVQHRDTVRYISGCAALGRVDTTVFLLFGVDSTRRLSSPARTFGQAMALSLIGQMRTVMIKERSAAMQTSIGTDLPNVRNQCAPAK